MSLGVLVVDDDPKQRGAMKRLLGVRRPVYAAGSLGEARDVLRATSIGIVIVDAQLGDESGLELLFELRDRFPEVLTGLLTGRDLEDLALEAAAGGARVIARKPTSPIALLDAIENHLGRAPRLLSSIALQMPPSDHVLPLALVEREHIEHAVRVARGNKAAAARQLGLSRQALYDKLTAFNVDE